MKILTIETTGHFASVALGTRQIMNDTDYSHLQEIVPMCQEILAAEKIGGKDLDAIAVSKGPGSFTGIRIGIATAKGLAQIWNKPIVAVPTLESFAYREGVGGIVVPVFDARRSQVYAGIFKDKETLLPAGAYDIEEFKKILADCVGAGAPRNDSDTTSQCHCERSEAISRCHCEQSEAISRCHCERSEAIHFFGDGCDLIGQKSEGVQEAKQVLRFAGKMLEEGKTETCYSVAPEYLRMAEAERKLLEKNS